MKKIISFILTLLLCVALVSANAEATRVYDNAGLFTTEDIQELEASIQQFQQHTKYDFVVLTTDDFLGPDNQRVIADNFYDSLNCGLDGERSGLAFYIDMDQRQQYISTTGNAIKLLDDELINAALDETTPSMTAGLYEEAVLTLINFVMDRYDSYWAGKLPACE